MIHYHGGPITPDPCAIRAWQAGHAFISYADSRQIGLAAEICQSFALDNGAYTFWKTKRPVNWPGYYAFVNEWRRHPGFDFAVVPDVIEGSEEENDALADAWPFSRHEAGVVWHINESFERLKRLALAWPLVCIGSCGEYDVAVPARYLPRARAAIRTICDRRSRPICKLHGLRVLNPAIFTQLPLASGDSTNIAQNIGVDSSWKGTYQPRSKETRAAILRERIESINSIGHLPSPVEAFLA
jgi:hypothetical protein